MNWIKNDKIDDHGMCIYYSRWKILFKCIWTVSGFSRREPASKRFFLVRMEDFKNKCEQVKTIPIRPNSYFDVRMRITWQLNLSLNYSSFLAKKINHFFLQRWFSAPKNLCFLVHPQKQNKNGNDLNLRPKNRMYYFSR